MQACMLGRFSSVQLCATLWTIAHQASLSIGILKVRILEYSCLGFPCPPPRDLPDPALQANSLPLSSNSLPGNSLPGKLNFRHTTGWSDAFIRYDWSPQYTKLLQYPWLYSLFVITSLWHIFCNWKLVPLNPRHPSSPHAPFIFSPLETTTLFSVSMNLFLFCLVF